MTKIRKIWKYQLPFPEEEIVISMPKEAEILCVQMQGNVPCIWVLVDPEAQTESINERIRELDGLYKDAKLSAKGYADEISNLNNELAEQRRELIEQQAQKAEEVIESYYQNIIAGI